MDIKTNTGLTEEHNKLACFILDKVYNADRDFTLTNNTIWDFKQKVDKETILKNTDLVTVINFLEVETWIEPQKYEGNNLQHKISDWAWMSLSGGGSFIDHYNNEQVQQEERDNSVELDKQIKELTKTHLEESIRKMRVWYIALTIVITTIMTIVTNIGIEYFKQQTGLNNTDQTTKHHEQN